MGNRPVVHAAIVACGALAATVATLPNEALAVPRDRVAARRLGRLLPPGSVVVVPPALPAPAARRAGTRLPRPVPTPPAARGPLVAQPPVTQPGPPAKTGTTPGSAAPAAVTRAGGVAPAATGVSPAAAQVPAAAAAPARTPAPTPTPVPALEPAADGTRSVLVPGGGAAATDAPIELLPVP